MAFLETNKVMLSVIAVVVLGGVVLASTFEPGDAASVEPEIAAENKPPEEPEQVADAPEEDAGWATPASFDDMLDDPNADSGFADGENPDEIGGDFDSGGFSSSTESEPAPAFKSKPAFSNKPAPKAPERIIVDSSKGVTAPIAVDASRVSAAAGGDGADSPNETE